MQIKKWENPEVVSLNTKDTKEPSLFHEPTAWQCLTCNKPTSATPVTPGQNNLGDPHRCDLCGSTNVIWIGDGQHPS
ncbi:MAG: hypothetical protein ACRCVJ_04035 [Clostridium sp.]|uniref:hypothetical protein n=1 Tax=Clostridium sp. TaxID=1506 RepID=UPI003F372184